MIISDRPKLYKPLVILTPLACLILGSCQTEVPAEIELKQDLNFNANIITACRQTVFDYAHSRDSVNIDANAALFTPSAKLLIGETVHEGRKEISAALAERGPKEFTRHVIASVSITVNDENKVKGKSYALVYAAAPRINPIKPVMTAIITPKVTLTYNDIFDLTSGRCLISERVITLDMVAQNEQ